jgi:NodT family efflux transporter outer membrane factor (OMF) lipoprotein
MPAQPDYAEMVTDEQKRVPVWSQQENARVTTTLNELINSDALDALLIEASNANPSLQQALLTLKIRRAQAKQIRANQLPEVDAGFSAEKVKNKDVSYTGSLGVSWELDLWQKLANNTNAANFDIQQQAALYQSAHDSLAADVMKSWLGLISQKQAIEIEQKRLLTLQKNKQFILQRYKNGLGTLEDLESARTSVLSSKSIIEDAKETLAQQQRALNTLLGRSEIVTMDIRSQYPEVLIPLADLPEQTLQRRPDLRAAYTAIQAESLRTDVAYKDMLPSISLSAALSDIASSPSAALLNNPVWTLLAQLTAPLYKGGKLKAAAEESELKTALQYQAYRETLLTAVNEVENALGQERALGKRQQHINEALNTARNTLMQYQSRYRNGLVTILDLLNVQQQTYDLEAQLNNIIYTRLYNRVDLGLALGLPVDTELKG